jgi:hypothetical protein
MNCYHHATKLDSYPHLYCTILCTHKTELKHAQASIAKGLILTSPEDCWMSQCQVRATLLEESTNARFCCLRYGTPLLRCTYPLLEDLVWSVQPFPGAIDCTLPTVIWGWHSIDEDLFGSLLIDKEQRYFEQPTAKKPHEWIKFTLCHKHVVVYFLF